jgi:hypothetical protein
MNHEHEFNGQENHLVTCVDCAEDKAILEQLHNESTLLSEEIPPSFVFNNIKQSLTVKESNKGVTWRRGIGLVASVAFIVFSAMTFSDYRLQNEFEDLLVQNKLLEEKLTPYQQVSLMGQPLFRQLQVIETNLWLESSMKRKVYLLEQRKLCIEEIIQLQQGVKNEFFI